MSNPVGKIIDSAHRYNKIVDYPSMLLGHFIVHKVVDQHWHFYIGANHACMTGEANFKALKLCNKKLLISTWRIYEIDKKNSVDGGRKIQAVRPFISILDLNVVFKT